ncbi:MAG: FAD-dependent oxidoreductase [Nitrospiraceae bacterium]|nr:FAD-dependent oxidoreductase [Nitrospiraceae bacterium]
MTLTQQSARLADAGALPKHSVEVLTDRCAGCQECYVRCPTAAIGFDELNWIVTVDDALCVACGQCERTCPFSAIKVHGDPEVDASHRHDIAHLSIPALQPWEETRQGFQTLEEAMAEAARCLQCPDPTCVRGCPAHNDIPSMMRSVVAGEIDAARTAFERTSHIGSICSRVCNQSAQCEGACSWNLAGAEPLAIGLVERYVFDHSRPHLPTAAPAGSSVAIVGSGPAALGASWELVAAGVKVTVLEAAETPGGLLNHGIPEFTLPITKVSEQWETLQSLGVELVTSHRVEEAELRELGLANSAVILAHGAGSPIRPPVKGIDSPIVSDAMEFLSKAGEALNEMRDLPELEGKSILVIGAGNTAMDVGRMAIRFGAKPLCVEWVAERFGKVRRDELAEAREEGVQVRFLTTATTLEGNKVTLVRTKHEDATKLPEVIPGTEEVVYADMVILALGYRLTGEFPDEAPKAPVRYTPPALIDRIWVASGIFNGVDEGAIGNLSIARDELTHKAAEPTYSNFYTVGDALIGPSTVVEAMAHGREAARAIIATLVKNTAPMQ